MRLGLVAALALCGGAMAAGACTTTTTITSTAGPDGGTEGDAEVLDPDDPANQPPHSLGTIVLGEAHAASSKSSPTPIVSATFVPDAAKAAACKKKVEGCDFSSAPKCKETTSATGCDSGEACSFDDACAPRCKKLCAKACEDGEVCVLEGGVATCEAEQMFDAGPLAFSGTTTPITLYPPYKYESDGKGAPFLAGSEIRVQAQGASGAGFEAFDDTFTATTFIQTTTALDKIPREKIYGTGSVPISWAPGSATIVITIASNGGVATCKATDADGRFEIPRAVIEAALGDRTEGTGAVSLSVARQRKDVKKNKVAKGTLRNATVQPEGWLELVTTSIESASFQGCSGTAAVCGSECVDLKEDPENCGSCGKRCSGQEVCAQGKCGSAQAACDACIQAECATEFNACNSSTACKGLMTCANACPANDEACLQTCLEQHPDGRAVLQPYLNCVQSSCAEPCGG